jgi:hypothetical protein
MRLLAPVDARRPWIPEDYTALFHSPVYASLSHGQRLRYNQLFALRSNEYIMMLEHDLIERLLPPLMRLPRVRHDGELCTAIATMRAEERRHYEGFAALNRAAHPALYPPGRERFFSRLPWHTRGLFTLVGALSGRFVFALWFLMAMEESSKTLARRMLAQRETHTLGPLDEGFIHVHHQHLKDETRHVHLDAWLVEHCLHASHPGVNAWLFKRMLPGVTTPTRGGSGARVIRQWVRECPELQPREEEFIAAQIALRDNAAFQHSLFNRRIMPETFALFDRCDALAQGLGEVMPGYRRQPA